MFQTIFPEQNSDVLEMMASDNVSSISFALEILGRKRAQLYRSELGLAEEDSDEFKRIKPDFQKRRKLFYLKEDEALFF